MMRGWEQGWVEGGAVTQAWWPQLTPKRKNSGIKLAHLTYPASNWNGQASTLLFPETLEVGCPEKSMVLCGLFSSWDSLRMGPTPKGYLLTALLGFGAINPSTKREPDRLHGNEFRGCLTKKALRHGRWLIFLGGRGNSQALNHCWTQDLGVALLCLIQIMRTYSCVCTDPLWMNAQKTGVSSHLQREGVSDREKGGRRKYSKETVLFTVWIFLSC